MIAEKPKQPAVGGRRDEIHDRLGKLSTELVKYRRAGNWHRYGHALAETDRLLDELDGVGAAAANHGARETNAESVREQRLARRPTVDRTKELQISEWWWKGWNRKYELTTPGTVADRLWTRRCRWALLRYQAACSEWGREAVARREPPSDSSSETAEEQT